MKLPPRLNTVFLWTLLSTNSLAIAETVEGFSEPFAKVELAVVEPGLLDAVEVSEGDLVAEGGKRPAGAWRNDDGMWDGFHDGIVETRKDAGRFAGSQRGE